MVLSGLSVQLTDGEREQRLYVLWGGEWVFIWAQRGNGTHNFCQSPSHTQIQERLVNVVQLCAEKGNSKYIAEYFLIIKKLFFFSEPEFLDEPDYKHKYENGSRNDVVVTRLSGYPDLHMLTLIF